MAVLHRFYYTVVMMLFLAITFFSLLAMSIHMSNSTKVLLERFETFSIQERGIIEVKVCKCKQTVPNCLLTVLCLCSDW